MIVFSVGFGVSVPLLAVASTYIMASLKTGKLYTLIAITGALSHLVRDPFIQAIWASALKISRKWHILPFLVLTVSSVISHPSQLLILADAISRCHCIIIVSSRYSY